MTLDGRNWAQTSDPQLVEPALTLAEFRIIAPAAKPATGYDLIGIDPHTLHRIMLIHIV